MKILGVVLIVLGIIMFIITGVSYTTEEKIIDAGPIQLSTEKEKDINWPPYAGGISIAAGIIVLALSRKK
ncbi:hypothetical protein QWY93_18065 [Echinicola jeungdonensis]|uniref:DUF3185 domain-containing protein n=1 Tax=Echinicola jeungdonensis TaxID=709343 RepID=A0ABV5J0C6_9BACT|nr:hypothetical protein [Echinicola jeungdonensis]MDN3671117.1 hypothetical protein [Echinicola jeungdonensis]MDN3671216.1 hypothetical protein [Echinicola jeungdonensis]